MTCHSASIRKRLIKRTFTGTRSVPKCRDEERPVMSENKRDRRIEFLSKTCTGGRVFRWSQGTHVRQNQDVMVDLVRKLRIKV